MLLLLFISRRSGKDGKRRRARNSGEGGFGGNGAAAAGKHLWSLVCVRYFLLLTSCLLGSYWIVGTSIRFYNFCLSISFFRVEWCNKYSVLNLNCFLFVAPKKKKSETEWDDAQTTSTEINYQRASKKFSIEQKNEMKWKGMDDDQRLLVKFQSASLLAMIVITRTGQIDEN